MNVQNKRDRHGTGMGGSSRQANTHVYNHGINPHSARDVLTQSFNPRADDPSPFSTTIRARFHAPLEAVPPPHPFHQRSPDPKIQSHWPWLNHFWMDPATRAQES